MHGRRCQSSRADGYRDLVRSRVGVVRRRLDFPPPRKASGVDRGRGRLESRNGKNHSWVERLHGRHARSSVACRSECAPRLAKDGTDSPPAGTVRPGGEVMCSSRAFQCLRIVGAASRNHTDRPASPIERDIRVTRRLPQEKPALAQRLRRQYQLKSLESRAEIDSLSAGSHAQRFVV